MLIVAAYVVSLFLVWRKAKEQLWSERVVFDTSIVTFLGGVIGARLIYIGTHFEEFGLRPLSWIVFTLFPGFSLFGGLAAACVVFALLMGRQKEIPLWELFDRYVVAFLAGSLIVYTATIMPNYHPIGWYKTVVLASLIILYWRLKSRVSLSPGTSGLILLLLFSLSMFFIDFLTVFHVYYGRLGDEQWGSITLSIVLLFIWVRKKRIGISKFFSRLIIRKRKRS
ncbi:prolipoprotein diacylglyceryl transferase [Candidatus Roizmanbacteria bacterium]|nr:prolipoprotein diacylglyceryl transferase [Candidatus Roizmanbacteria bacterium]